jgi:hypothetical protein
MATENYKTSFLNAAAEWLCDSYSVNIRYLVFKQEKQLHLIEASIALNPLPGDESTSFEINTPGLVVGMFDRNGASKAQILEILEQACQGIIQISGSRYALNFPQNPDFYSEMLIRDRWFSDLHLQVSGVQTQALLTASVIELDNQLRRSDPPFDGLADVSSFLGFTTPIAASPPVIKIRIGPPVDVMSDLSGIRNNELSVVLNAHPKFDLTKVGLSVRGIPGATLAVRKQVAPQLQWSELNADRVQGTVQIPFEQLDSALVMLTLSETTVRRMWLGDPTKAPNSRFLAMQMFDKDLRMVRQALEKQDSVRFEKAVAALAFLLGFAPAIQLEDDSPDIILTTSGGKVVLVECTTRIADFSAKIGKLVDRCRALSKSFESSGHVVAVHGILACGLPRDQIAFREAELKAHRLILLSKDELISEFDRLRFPRNPDELIETASANSFGTTQPSVT